MTNKPKCPNPTNRNSDSGITDHDRKEKFFRTYVFRRPDAKREFFKPVFDLCQQDGSLKTDEQVCREGYFLEILADYPLRPAVKSGMDFNMRQHAERFFKEVIFLGTYQQGRNGSKHLDWQFHRVVLDKKANEDITALIQQFNLEAQRPFIIQLLAQVQDYYVERVLRSEPKQITNELKIIDKQVEQFVEILQCFEEPKESKTKKVRKEPDEIIFKYHDGTVRLKSKSLIYNLLKSLVEKYAEPPIGNWKPSVRNIAWVFKEFHKNHQYLERLTIAFHNWLIKSKLITPTKANSKSSNSGFRFIAEFFKVAGIVNEEDFTGIASDVNKLRNYTTRKKLEENPDIVIFPRDLSRLEKHFPPELLKLTTETKSADNLHTAHSIKERFELPDLFEDLAQLTEALEKMKRLPHFNTLLIPNINQSSAEIPDVAAFDRLLQLSQKDIPASETSGINSLSFTCKGSSRIHQISKEIPLSIIQKAIREYAQNHPEEFSFDIIAHDIYYKNPGDRLPFVKHKNEFNPPGKRFFPTICKCFYNYLLEYDPPRDKANPKLKYFQIIAVMFISCYSDELWDADKERKMVEKVSEWYELSLHSEA